jgi:hypothetical protein
MSWHSEVRSMPRYYFEFLDDEDFVKECLSAADPSVLVDIDYLPPGSDPSATASSRFTSACGTFRRFFE